MIASFRHKGLKRLFEEDNPRGVAGEHVSKLINILVRIDAAFTISDIDVPSFGLHALKGERKGFWAVTVRANWHVIFRFEEGQAVDVDYLDYH